MDGNLLHGREDNQAVGIQLAGQATGGKILVNDRRSALQMEPLGAEHRDAPAAAGDDHQAGRGSAMSRQSKSRGPPGPLPIYCVLALVDLLDWLSV